MNTTIPRFLLPSIAQQTRQAHHPKAGTAKIQRLERKRKAHKTYRTNRLEKMEQFSLCDAIRYVEARSSGKLWICVVVGLLADAMLLPVLDTPAHAKSAKSPRP